MTSPPSVYETQGPHASPYTAWLKYCNEREVLKTAFEQRFGEWAGTRNEQNLSIVDMGSGAGVSARRITDILDIHGRKYSFTAVDPYQEQLDQFRAWAGEDYFQYVRAGFEDFVPERKYDLALAIHSLYYAQNMEAALTKIHSFAERAMIVHHGRQGLCTVQSQFPHHVKSKNKWDSTYADVTAVLYSLGIPYRTTFHDADLDVSSCKDPTNQEGVDLIKFLVDNATLSEKEVGEVRAFVKTLPDHFIHDIGLIITTPLEL